MFCDRTHPEVREALSPSHRLDADVSREFLAAHFARPGAATPVDRALRVDAEVMLVEDPVKRVGNMTMAWGLEARVPFLDHELVTLAAACPPELKLSQGGKGVLKTMGRRLLPVEVVDRPKGYFPVPPLVQLEAPFVELLRDALSSPVARDRGLFEPGSRRAPAGLAQRADQAPLRQALAGRASRAVAADPPYLKEPSSGRRPHVTHA